MITITIKKDEVEVERTVDETLVDIGTFVEDMIDSLDKSKDV